MFRVARISVVIAQLSIFYYFDLAIFVQLISTSLIFSCDLNFFSFHPYKSIAF